MYVCMKCVYSGLQSWVSVDYVIESYVGIPTKFLRRMYKYVCMEYVYKRLHNNVYVDNVELCRNICEPSKTSM
jgi:hypothetical protein